MKDRLGERIGWIAGWIGGFIWVVILSILFIYQKRLLHSLIGIVLIAAAINAIFYFAPWRHPSTSYWKLMLIPYLLFFASVIWAIWALGGLESVGFNLWNLLWLAPALSPFGMLSNKKWSEPETQRDGHTDH